MSKRIENEKWYVYNPTNKGDSLPDRYHPFVGKKFKVIRFGEEDGPIRRKGPVKVLFENGREMIIGLPSAENSGVEIYEHTN